jgi:hypothetical protein
MAELVHQALSICAGPEHQNDIGVKDLREFVAFLGEMPDVFP